MAGIFIALIVLSFLPSFGSTTNTPGFPTTPPTTIPKTTMPHDGCLHDGRFYANGEYIDKDEDYGCYSTICEDGGIVAYDHQCLFYTPYCAGTSEKVLGQCCPVCHNETTTPPTTIPQSTTTRTTTSHLITTPPGGCEYDGRIYMNGEHIDRDEDYDCYGTICQDGGIVAYDHQCFFYTPYCAGTSEKVLGQCCPVCHNETTTPPTTIPQSTTTRTTTPHLITTPPGGCEYDGRMYMNGEDIYRDENNCGGIICDDGQHLNWDDACAFDIPPCNGLSERVKGQCCPLCLNSTTVFSTFTTTTQGPGCQINGKQYQNGQRTNFDPCYVCRCTINGTESCMNITCNSTLDCEVTYIPFGECCYTCGCSHVITSTGVLLMLFFLSEELRLM